MCSLYSLTIFVNMTGDFCLSLHTESKIQQLQRDFCRQLCAVLDSTTKALTLTPKQQAVVFRYANSSLEYHLHGFVGQPDTADCTDSDLRDFASHPLVDVRFAMARVLGLHRMAALLQHSDTAYIACKQIYNNCRLRAIAGKLQQHVGPHPAAAPCPEPSCNEPPVC